MNIGQFISGDACNRLLDAAVLVGTDGRIIDVSDAALRCYGYTREQMLAMTTADIRVSPDPDALEEPSPALFEEDSWQVELHRRHDGTVFAVELRALSVDSDGERAWLIAIRESPGRRELEDALRHSETRLGLALAATVQGIYDLDVPSGVAVVTPEYLSIMGEDPSRLTFGVAEFAAKVHPDDADRVAAVLDACVRGETEEYREEFRLRRTDGEWVWVLSIGRSVERDEHGIATRILGSHTEITERKLAEEQLETQRRWLVQSQRVAQLGHYNYDIERDHWDGSDVLYEVLGVDSGHARDFEGWLATVHPEDRESMASYFAEDVIGRRRPFDREYRVVRLTDGAERWVHGLGTVEFSDDGRPLRMFGVIQDVTDAKSAEVELERRGTRLEQLLAERERNLELMGHSLFSIIEVVSRVVEARDPYTAGHERRVAELAMRISSELGMSAEQAEETRIAALIHDVGKMTVPAEILSKPGRLSAVEFELVKSHAQAGYELLSSANLGGQTAEIIYQHHERCDGSGYPRGLGSDDLLQASKVIMVADVVEAMSSHRPYRPARGIDLALDEIERGAGGIYCPYAAEACLRVFRDDGFEFARA